MTSLLAWVAAVALSQDTTPVYRIDLARHFFATPAAELAARDHLRERTAALRNTGQRLRTSPAALLRALRLADSVRMESKRHTIYLYLRTPLNTLDEASAQAESALEGELDAATSVIRNGLLQLDDRTLAAWVRKLPAREEYRFVIASVRRHRQHILSPAQEALLARLTPLAEDWPPALYHRLIARTDFGTLHTPAGELRVLRDRGAIAAVPDSAVRAQGSRKVRGGLG